MQNQSADSRGSTDGFVRGAYGGYGRGSYGTSSQMNSPRLSGGDNRAESSWRDGPDALNSFGARASGPDFHPGNQGTNQSTDQCTGSHFDSPKSQGFSYAGSFPYSGNFGRQGSPAAGRNAV